MTQDRGPAGRRPQQAAQHSNQRRLAGAVGAENCQQLTTIYGQVDSIDGHDVAESPGESLSCDGDITT